MTQAAAEHNRNIELIDDIIGRGHLVVARKEFDWRLIRAVIGGPILGVRSYRSDTHQSPLETKSASRCG
jgi:hypothetical protein